MKTMPKLAAPKKGLTNIKRIARCENHLAHRQSRCTSLDELRSCDSRRKTSFLSLDCTGDYATCRKHSLRCTIACPISVCPKKAKLNSSRHHRDPPPCRMQLYFCWSRARSLDQWAENISFSLTRVPRKPPSGSETFKNSFLLPPVVTSPVAAFLSRDQSR